MTKSCSRQRKPRSSVRNPVKALACQLPAAVGAPLARWSCPELAREVVAQGVAETMSAATVRRTSA